jgi:hypothetical protein
MRGDRLAIFVISLLVACTPAKEELSGIDWTTWKGDRNGCLQKRIAYLSPVQSQVEKLKARSEMDIVALMGRPDATELSRRNQKFYTYFISAGPACEQSDSISKKLIIRFNAMGMAKEVTVE